MASSNEIERRAVGDERVEFRTTLKPGWGWLRWLEVSGRIPQVRGSRGAP